MLVATKQLWLATALSLAAASPAFAQATEGGAGGSSSAFSNGGTSSATSQGGYGGDSPAVIRGGGGGGAGASGGGGGSGSGGAVGGNGGIGAGLSGGGGGNGSSGNSGGGGGGGAHGDVVTVDTVNAATTTGGAGGHGGSSTGTASGGGGGAGGYGVVVDGSVLTYSNNGTIGGGNGGNGGANTTGNGFGGNGGDGGYGVYLTGSSILSNSGTIAGGNGGGGGNATSSTQNSAGGDGGNGGTAVTFASGGTLINSGTITGGTSGAPGAGSSSSLPNGVKSDGEAGSAGDGVVGANLTIINSGTISAGVNLGAAVDANAITFTGGSNILELWAGSVINGNVVGTGTDTFRLGGSTDSTFDVSGIGSTAQYQAFSSFVKTGGSTWTLTGTTTATTPWSINQGTLAVSSDDNLGAASGGLAFGGGTLQFLAGFSSSRTVTLNAGGGTIDTNGYDAALDGAVGGTGGLTKIGNGTLALTGVNSYSGGTAVNGGTLAVASDSSLGAASGGLSLDGGTLQFLAGFSTARTVTLNAGGGTFDTNGFNATLDGPIGGAGGLTKIGSGTLVLAGISSYSGATTVNAGVLDVEGTITTSAATVNAGGALTGAGTLAPQTLTVNAGGLLAPGNGTSGSSFTIIGNLALQSGAIYLVQLDPAAASSTNVTSGATLGGATVKAVFANGSYVSKTYTILTADAGISGTFSSLVNTNLPANFAASLSYDANDVFLDLTLSYTIPSGLNRNQQAVGNALTNFFNANGGIPLVYGAMTPAGLTQASGELGTGSQQTTFNAMNGFIGLLMDPSMQWIDRPGGSNGTSGFAADDSATTRANRKPTDAFAMLPHPREDTFAQRWNAWASGFGGSQSTSGNAALGSNDTTSRILGTAVGADYRFSPQTLAGFALAGGGTNFGVTGLGSGRSDLFQAGAYLRHIVGPAYISAALAYGWQDITTDRSVGVDRLRAEFNANAYSGRVEGGYRFVAPVGTGIGLTTYAAAQATTFNLPAYAEQVVSGASTFALSYASKTVTDARSELGLRSDKSVAVPDGILTLRGRLAWMYDFNPDRSVATTFQSLPGASFVVNGAAQARNAALTTTSAELKWSNGWSAAATFEGELTAVTRSYAGKGAVRYAW
ncbi:autotransporter domain-containing protein [Bradyrhizobium sp. Ec3.3]|uniref:autotransporter outer membrane beta-barrel domain-containing protein n=1 Tax=Bradyrhizobium sp. Ec3.3 TaxID=189753 RepID=UPI0003FC39DE|nr:autotransporter outer membrane beta-barrel domain-containing protein [Bradyrhizobium sp. Ec3.3]